MARMKFRQLIDMAIGFPEPGHVDFSALHCLLSCIAEKLEITDEIIDYSHNETETNCYWTKYSNEDLHRKSRLFGGSNINEKISDEEPSEAEENPIENIMQEKDLKDSVEHEEEQVATAVFEDIKSKELGDQDIEQKPIIEVPYSAISVESQLTLPKINEHILKIEAIEEIITKELVPGITIMKDQLEFVIEQLLLLAFLTLSKKPDSQHIQQLYSMAQTLHEIKNVNIYIKGFSQLQLPTFQLLNWSPSGLKINEDLSKNDLLEIQSNGSAQDDAQLQTAYEDGLEGHLCYSPEKLLDQLMELKSEFCLLTNKVNELSSRLLQQESQRTVSLIQAIQEQIHNVKVTTITLKESQTTMEMRLTSNQGNIEKIKTNLEEIIADKVDKSELEIQLADKVDYAQLQRKVSHDQILELQCRIDKKFCEILRQITENDKKFSQTVDNLKETLGFAAIDAVLKNFKENISKDIQALHELLKTYTESTNTDCAAAGSRIKVLQNLACLSCDTNCVMRTTEKAKVAKLSSAHTSNILSPLITYELGSIRKSGIMGYHRKDEFPHSTHAWLTRQSNTLNDLKRCVPRHAGGQHTTNDAKDRVKKMVSNRK